MQTDVGIYGHGNCKACKRCFYLRNSGLERRMAIAFAVESKQNLGPSSRLQGIENKLKNASYGLIA